MAFVNDGHVMCRDYCHLRTAPHYSWGPKRLRQANNTSSDRVKIRHTYSKTLHILSRGHPFRRRPGSYPYNYKTPWSKGVLEKPIFVHLVKKFPSWRTVTVFHRAQPLAIGLLSLPAKLFYASLICPMHATHRTHLILLDLIFLIITDMYKL